MKTLCINTCFKNAEIYLNGERSQYVCIDSNCKHSEHVMPTIEKMLETNNINPRDIDLFGICVGPGSFTGIRIGVALVKGLGLNDKKCIQFNSFELLATQYFINNPEKSRVMVIMDGLSGNVFVGAYSNDLGELIAPQVVDFEGMRNLLKSGNYDVISGVEDKDKFSLPYVEVEERAYQEILNIKSAKGEIIPVSDITPIYLRKSQAEVELEKKENANKWVSLGRFVGCIWHN